jgi:hypothetical protein
MIPLCSLDVLKYTDSDDTYWEFKPCTGHYERRLIAINEAVNSKDDKTSDNDIIEMIDSMISEIVLRCSPKDNPDHFNDKLIVDELVRSEKIRILFKEWQLANVVSDEEKKT